MDCKVCKKKFTKLNDVISHAIGEKLKVHPIHFVCTPCALPIYDIPSVVQHIDSIEHSIMILATGIRFDKSGNNSDILVKESFPPHNCCLICGCRDLSRNNSHLKGPKHKHFVSLIAEIIKSKQMNITSMPKMFTSSLINVVKQKEFIGAAHARTVFLDSSQFFCELCNIYFNKLERYKQHLEDQSHKRTEQFIIKVADAVKEIDIIGGSKSHINAQNTFSNSLMPLYYCDLCDIFVDSFINYDSHLRSISHTRVEELFIKLEAKRNGDIIRLNDVASINFIHMNYSQHYCKLCAVGFNDAIIYRDHLKVIGHKRLEHFVESLPSMSDKKFINVYINAKAHMIFNNTPPPNYCELCDILHSKYEKYKQHLLSEEHKQSEKYYVKVKRPSDAYFEENNSKMLKTYPETLDRDHRRNEPNQILHCKHRNVDFGARSFKTNSSWSGFDAFETRSELPSRFCFEADETNTYSDFWKTDSRPRETNYESPSPFEFLARENSHKFGFGVPDYRSNSRPPFVGFEASEYRMNSRPLFDCEIPEFRDRFHSLHGFKKEEINYSAPPEFQDIEINQDPTYQEHYCELCDFVCYSSVHYSKHLMGDQHKKMRKMVNKKGKEICFDTQRWDESSNSHPLRYNCELCDVFNDDYQEYEFHLNSPKHQRNHWLLFVLMQKSL